MAKETSDIRPVLREDPGDVYCQHDADSKMRTVRERSEDELAAE